MTRSFVLRWSTLAVMAGCQAADPNTTPSPLPTAAVEQGISGSFCLVKMPAKIPYVPGSTPIKAATPVDSTGYVIVQDPDKAGYFVAGLADLGQGQITVAYSVANADLPWFNYFSTYKGRTTTPNTPGGGLGPHPGGNDWIAHYMLEIELASTNVSKDALAAANSCP